MAEVLDVEFTDFIFAGSPVELKRTYKLVVESIGFTFNGENVSLLKEYPPLIVETIDFSLVGSLVGLSKIYTLDVENTTFPFEGQDIALDNFVEEVYSPDYNQDYQKYSYQGDAFLGGRYVRNMLPWSEDMQNGSNWTRTLVTVTNNAGTDPDGGNTATRIVGTAGAWDLIDNSIAEIVSGDVGTTSMWVKSNTGSSQTFRLQVFGRTSANLTATTSWQRFAFTHTSVGNSYSAITRDNVSTAADLLVWYPQVEFGSEASEYIKTEDKPVYGVFANEYANTVSSNIVTEIVGAPLAQAPYLISQFSTTNELEQARDLTGWTTVATATGTDTLTGVGLNNKLNTCTIIDVTAASASQYYGLESEQVAISSGNFVCLSVLIDKDSTSNETEVQLIFDGSASQITSYSVVQDTGAVIAINEDSDLQEYEVIDRGLWWQLLIYAHDNFTSSYITMKVLATTDGTTAIVGETKFDAAQVYINKTIDEVKNLPPILTNGTTLTIQDKFPTWDASYHTADQGLYYFEFFYNGGYYDLLKIGDDTLLRTAQIENINDELVDEQPSVANWQRYGTNIEEDDNGAYKITCVDSYNGAYTFLDVGNALNRDTVHGEKIFVKADIKISTVLEADTFDFVIKAQGVDSFIPLYTTIDFVTIVGEGIISLTSLTPNLRFDGMSVGDIVWIKNLSIHAAQDGVEALSGGTISLPLINGEHNKVGIAYGQDTFDLNLNNSRAPQTSFVPISGEISTNGIIRELKHYDNNSALSREIIEDLM